MSESKIKKVSVIFGTRPEAVKLCPVVRELKKHQELETEVCVTAQHREMLDQVLEVFGVKPDTDLNLIRPDQSLSEFTSRAMKALDQYLESSRPDVVLVQGDTTTVFAAALTCFYRKVSVGHVEAGLRTYNKFSPFPEEMNRVITTRLSDYHFAPTERAASNLRAESVPEEKIFLTGNTVIDALNLAVERVRADRPVIEGLDSGLMESETPLVLITGHRRENFGEGFESICRAIAALAKKFPETHFVYPVHLNPNVKKPVYGMLAGKDNIKLLPPLSYLPFVSLMERSTLILTDSGGIQEEAPTLGKPVLVMRDTTERPEALEAGTSKLVGTDQDKIVSEADKLLTDSKAYRAMSEKSNPFGDGKASERIINALLAN